MIETQLLSGTIVAAAVKEEVAERVVALAKRDRTVGLATVLVGEDPASEVYVRNKRRTAENLGITSIHHQLPADTSQGEVDDLIGRLNEDPAVDGILVQLPLPAGLDGERAVNLIDPTKDADGLHPSNLGKLILGRPGLTPCTPTGVMRILEHYGIEVAGRHAVVIGRSFLVGRPLALLFNQKGVDATVTMAHSRTPNLAAVARAADIVVAAVGVPKLVGPDFVKPGATVIDVGINRTDVGLVGDADFEALQGIAGAMTPVPKGVGPMTVAMLMHNTVTAAEATS
ncbi:MAG: bifunctional methylenetetrahydrofolate dehydrogenase/methenyltetrahydrofolate cyclohydrolase FolD [Acidimicrobiia bacterium]|nr:bifunctional methylenetetrahydrofolate dehydrogenase/methenyltetrahydrofolate cyclohydrolase FolD [Acidimicrobiia bacterium]